MNRPRSLGLYPDDLATVEPSPVSAPTLSILGLTILGSPRTFGFPSRSSIDRTDVKFELFRK